MAAPVADDPRPSSPRSRCSAAAMTVAASTRVALPAEPYPGLRPFEPNEHRIFFGREEMIDTVIDALARKNLVVVHGASGSGKSSFVRAGGGSRSNRAADAIG